MRPPRHGGVWGSAAGPRGAGRAACGGLLFLGFEGRLDLVGEVGGVIDNRYHTAYTYDKNGNMPTLIRYGKTDGANYGIVDELSAVYNGNQLKSVEDASDMVSHHESGDFKDFSTETTEYTYNANGALTRDLNKSVSSISYNSLNLPRQIETEIVPGT